MRNNVSKLNGWLFWGIALILVSIFITWYIFGLYFIHPNDHVFMFGGDGFVIYYDMLYHIKYGTGPFFHAMNYPNPELMFLTDAQASWSILLSYINNFIPLESSVIGIVNFIMIWSIPFSAILLFLIFKRFEINPGLAFMGSLLITFLSPQLLRIVGGHFAHGFIAIIPLCLYWLVYPSNGRFYTFLTIILFIILLFFGFNNGYTGIITSFTLIIFGIFYFLFSKKDSEAKSKAIHSIIIGILVVTIFYIINSMLDPYNDRLEIQWGYFHHILRPVDFLYPETSLLNKLIGLFTENPKGYVINNLSIVPYIFIIYYLINRLVKKKRDFWGTNNTLLETLQWTGLFSLFVSLGFPFVNILENFFEDYLSVLTMVKSPLRFAWVFYYCCTITCFIWLSRMAEKYFNNKKMIVGIITLLITIPWALDASGYIQKIKRKEFHPNVFEDKDFQKLQSQLKELDINLNNYQALYTIPRMVTWHDNFITHVEFFSHYYSLRTSIATGIPLINGMLSRQSTSKVMEEIQFVSNPLIKREWLKKADLDRDILLVVGAKDHPLIEGENYLISKSDTLFTSTEYSFYKLSPKDLANAEQYQNAFELCKISHSSNVKPLAHNTFDDFQSKRILWGKGSKVIPEGMNTVHSGEITLPSNSNSLELSFWIYQDHLKYGTPTFTLELSDYKSKIFKSSIFGTREQVDFYQNWQRISYTFTPSLNSFKYKLKAEMNQPYTFDELMIRYLNDTVIIRDLEKNRWLFNNYILEDD